MWKVAASPQLGLPIFLFFEEYPLRVRGLGWNQPLGTAGFFARPRPRKAGGPALRRDEDRGIDRPERNRSD